ncbi:MAG: TlpA family protein disulfide reductase [Chloroflexi bacterium]|nr:TlpA family protein disulfide reductase [Chloroflexota bacterium]
MTTRTRAALLSVGLLLMIVGLAVLARVGLPTRAAYSGRSDALIGAEARYIAPEIDALAPPFRAQTLGGDVIELAALRGSPVIVNFWATWCGPCEIEMPELQAFVENTDADPRAADVRLLAVNLGEHPTQIRPWLAARGLTLDVVLDPVGALAEVYRLRGQPSTYVISPNGVITHIFYGPTTRSALLAAVASSAAENR